jgi:hypothetical protein
MLNKFSIAAFSLVFVALIGSCGNKKSSTVEHGLMAEGTVKVSAQSGECQLWIMSTHTSATTGFYPVNLDDQFKKNNLKIAFNFNDSRAPLPENCTSLKAIVISEVKVLK